MRATEVAEKAGITAAHLRGCERGQFEPSAPVYIRICEALGIDPDELRKPREDELRALRKGAA